MRAVLGLAALTGCLFPGAIFLGRTLYFRDIHLLWYGQIESLVRTVAAGAWPLWDPYTSFGQPLLANGNSQLFYPLTWLNLLVRPPTYFTIYAVLHGLFTGTGLFLFGRRLGMSAGGAWVAAAVWTACGPMLSLVNLWNHFAGAAWIPWVMLAADVALTSGRTGWLAWGACLAAQMLAGSPDMFVVASLLSGGYALTFLLRRDGDHRLVVRVLGTGLAALVAAFGLSAAQWIPSLELVQQSARSSLPEDIRAAWSLHPANLAQAVLPLAWDDPALTPGVRAALFEGREPLLASLYLGMPAVGLVAAACGRRGRRGVVFFLIAAAVSGVIALGYHSPAYGLAVSLVPPLRMLRYPSKAIVVAALGWAVLAGKGFDAWSEPDRGRLAWRVGVAGPLVAAVAVGIALAVAIGHGVRWSLVLSIVLAGVVAAVAAVRPASRRAAGAAAALVVVDLVLANRGLNPTAPRDFFRFRPPVLDALKQEDGRRLYVYDYSALPDRGRRHLGRDAPYRMFLPPGTPRWAEAWGMRAYLAGPFAGGHGLYASYDDDLLKIHPRPLTQLSDALLRADDTPMQLRLLRLGAVGDVIALHRPALDGLVEGGSFAALFPEPIVVFHVPDARPRAYVVSGARVADGPSALSLVGDPAFDAAREVVLAEGTPMPVSPTFSGSARILALSPDRLRLDVELSEPGYVVLADAYAPGWRASVDGRDAPVLRANLAFRAVRLEPGRHVVEQVYRPRSVAVGLVVSAATLIAALLAVRMLDRPLPRVRATLDSIPAPR